MKLLLFSPLDLIGVVVGLLFALPWAALLIPPRWRDWPAVLLLTLALSLGALTLWMALLAGVGGLSLGWVLAGIVTAGGIGAALTWRMPVFPRGWRRMLRQQLRGNLLTWGVVLIVVVIAGLIALNAVFWPFHEDDAVSIYALFSRQFYQTRALPVGDRLYEAYPMLLPLSHTYAYLIAGAINEYLAKVAVAVLGVGVLGAAWLLGRTLYNGRTGLIAALLLALTPSFARWAPSGYTDVPVAFFVTLCAVAGWWLYEDGSFRSAVLLGILGGLAAWTKNSALTLAVSVGLWMLYLVWQRRIAWRTGAAALGAFALTAGPWYVRNWIEFGRPVTQTVWTDQAQRTLANLVPFVTAWRWFLLPGVIVTVGLVLALIDMARGTQPLPKSLLARRRGTSNVFLPRDAGGRRDRALWLMLVGLPFGAAWWWMASYDTRFLLAVLPVGAVLGAHALTRGWEALPSTRWALRPATQIGIVLLLIALAVPSARKALSFKGDLLRHPTMSDAARHRVTLGPVYDVALMLRALPARGLVLSDTNMLPFELNQAGVVRVVVGWLPDHAALAQYDYLVYSPGNDLPAFVQPEDVRLLAEIAGFRVYAVEETP